MTDYRNLIPPVGEDSLEYALKRVGHSAARIRARNVNEVTIVSAHASAGDTVHIQIRKPKDPYYNTLPNANDAAAWDIVKRIVHRFPIQAVLAHLFPDGLSQDFSDIDELTDLLNDGGLGLTKTDYTYTVQHNVLTITMINPTSLLGFGTGTVKLVEVNPPEDQE